MPPEDTFTDWPGLCVDDTATVVLGPPTPSGVDGVVIELWDVEVVPFSVVEVWAWCELEHAPRKTTAVAAATALLI